MTSRFAPALTSYTSDSWPVSQAKPLASLSRCRDAVSTDALGSDVCVGGGVGEGSSGPTHRTTSCRVQSDFTASSAKPRADKPSAAGAMN